MNLMPGDYKSDDGFVDRLVSFYMGASSKVDMFVFFCRTNMFPESVWVFG